MIRVVESRLGGPIVVQGDGTPRRPYLYAADLAIWLWSIAFRGQSCRPYNAGSPESPTIQDLARLASDHFVPRPVVEVRGASQPRTTIQRYVPDTTWARLELGLALTIALPDALSRTIRYLRSASGQSWSA